MAAERASAAVILASSHLGFALSTTQVATGSILGTGVGRPGAQVRWRGRRPHGRRLARSPCRRRPSSARVMWWIGDLLGGLAGALVDLRDPAARWPASCTCGRAAAGRPHQRQRRLGRGTAAEPRARRRELRGATTMHNLGFALDGAWKVLLAGLVLGAGLPVLFALGIRSLAYGAGGDAEVHEPGVTGRRRTRSARSLAGSASPGACWRRRARASRSSSPPASARRSASSTSTRRSSASTEGSVRSDPRCRVRGAGLRTGQVLLLDQLRRSGGHGRRRGAAGPALP